MLMMYAYFVGFVYSTWSDRKKAKAKALAPDVEMNVQGAADPTTSETPLLAVPK